MRHTLIRLTLLMFSMAAALAGSHAPEGAEAVPTAADGAGEKRFISRARRLTFEGRRAGEGYFSPDGTQLVFQSEREEGNPFFQIYVLDFESGEARRVSPGHGKTTCAFFHADGKRILFSSTHHDPRSLEYQQVELESNMDNIKVKTKTAGGIAANLAKLKKLKSGG
jgi:Tol biopolymer transport system component